MTTMLRLVFGFISTPETGRTSGPGPSSPRPVSHEAFMAAKLDADECPGLLSARPAACGAADTRQRRGQLYRQGQLDVDCYSRHILNWRWWPDGERRRVAVGQVVEVLGGDPQLMFLDPVCPPSQSPRAAATCRASPNQPRSVVIPTRVRH